MPFLTIHNSVIFHTNTHMFCSTGVLIVGRDEKAVVVNEADAVAAERGLVVAVAVSDAGVGGVGAERGVRVVRGRGIGLERGGEIGLGRGGGIGLGRGGDIAAGAGTHT